MLSNPLAWVVLAAFLAAVLALKGYVKLPSRPKGLPTPPGTTAPAGVALDQLDSHALGVFFALALRREAESELARTLASKAGADIKTAFQAPFSPPAPAGQNQDQAGVSPTP